MIVSPARTSLSGRSALRKLRALAFFETGFTQPSGTTNLGIHQNSSESAGKTLATIGNGSITVGGEATTPEGLNRDVEAVEKELYSIDRVKGDLDLTVDNQTLEEVADKVSEGAEAMTDALGLTGMSEEERLALAETISAEFFGGLDAVKAKNEAQKAEQQKMVADEVDKILLSLGLPTEEVPGEAVPGEMTFYVAEVRAALIASQADGLDPVAAALAMAKLKLDVESIPSKDISNPEAKDKALYQIDLVMQSYLDKYETAEALGGVGLPLTVRRLVIAGAKDVMEHGAEAAAPVYQKLESLIAGKSPDVPATQSAGGLGGELNSTDIGMTFGKGIVKQGKPFEAYVQGNLPQGTLDLNSIKGNFSTFDHLTPDGIAISTKTLDTSASSYQNPSKITYTLNKYVDQMIAFERDGKGTQIITNAMFAGKQMQLGIPANASAEQMAAIAKSIQYAQSKGISVVVTKVKS